MNKLITLTAILAVSCALQKKPEETPPRECKVTQVDEGAVIACPGSAPVTVNNGRDGGSITGPKGDKGEQGDSIQGPAGKDGESIQGPAGRDGTDGINTNPVTEVRPCPDTWKPNTELFLCINSTLYAVYDPSQLGGVHLTALDEGATYQTTDGRACVFTVKPNCELE